MHEEQFITAGAAKNQFTLAGVLSAGVICYDIRFPEWLRTNALGGAKIIYVSAEWPESRIKQWETLLAARAIENQAFVVAVNRVGNDPDNHFSGHSQVIDPLGNVVLDAGEDEALVTTEFDFDQIDQVRGSIPVFDDRRPELYE
jgi:predicted amidohydrolase